MEWTGQRFADLPAVAVSAYIDAPPERVWVLVSDINLMPRLSAELQEVGWLDGAGRPCGRAAFPGPQHPPRPGQLGDGQHDCHLRRTTRVRMGGRGHRRACGQLADHPAPTGPGHRAGAVGPAGTRAVRPQSGHRRQAGERAEDRVRPAAGMGGRSRPTWPRSRSWPRQRRDADCDHGGRVGRELAGDHGVRLRGGEAGPGHLLGRGSLGKRRTLPAGVSRGADREHAAGLGCDPGRHPLAGRDRAPR